MHLLIIMAEKLDIIGPEKSWRLLIRPSRPEEFMALQILIKL